MEEGKFRNKVTWFTFFFSLFVVWVHSYNGELFLGKTTRGFTVVWLERLIGETAGQIAVPGFFMISAYLFYRNFDWSCLGRKWKSRIHSILIPYLLWNLIYYAGYVIGSRLPFIGHVMGKGVIPIDPLTMLDAVINHRYLYVFWYLKQLILLIGLAPLLYLVLKRTWSGILFLLIMLYMVWTAADIPYFNEDALFYYSTGAFSALHGRWMEKSWKKERGWMGIALIGLGALNFYWTMRYFLPGTTVMFRFLTPAGLWMIVDEGRLPAARRWMECNFTLYAVHFAFVRLINKTAAALFPARMLFPLIIYLLMPVSMAAVSFLLSVVMKRYMPGIWRVLNGRR